MTLTPEQERAEHIAGMVRRVRENREARQGVPAPAQAPEAVSEALNDIAARREAERTTAEQTQQSLKERLAKSRQEREAARTAAPNAGGARYGSPTGKARKTSSAPLAWS